MRCVSLERVKGRLLSASWDVRFKQKKHCGCYISMLYNVLFVKKISGRDDIGLTWTTVLDVHELRLLSAKLSHALRVLLHLATNLSK